MTTPSFHGFYGQRRKVAYLRRQVAGAQEAGRPCPHRLIIGPSGMGKTVLCEALALAYGTRCLTLHGKVSPRELCEAAVQLKFGDFLHLDEPHSLPKEVQEMVFLLADRCRLPDHLGAGPASDGAQRDDGRLVIAPCTILLSTNQPTGVLPPLRERMGRPVLLDDYSLRELSEVGAAAATDLKMLVSPQALGALARASQGRPRRMKILLGELHLRYYADVARGRKLSKADVRRHLAEAGMDAQGLDDAQQKYLRKLYKLRRASLNTMAGHLGVDAAHVYEEVEAGLLKLDYIAILNHGRILTKGGKEWVGKDRARRKARKQRRQKRKEGGGGND
jgi:Holliday junction DNA helicase RuvB